MPLWKLSLSFASNPIYCGRGNLSQNIIALDNRKMPSSFNKMTTPPLIMPIHLRDPVMNVPGLRISRKFTRTTGFYEEFQLPLRLLGLVTAENGGRFHWAQPVSANEQMIKRFAVMIYVSIPVTLQWIRRLFRRLCMKVNHQMNKSMRWRRQ